MKVILVMEDLKCYQPNERSGVVREDIDLKADDTEDPVSHKMNFLTTDPAPRERHLSEGAIGKAFAGEAAEIICKNSLDAVRNAIRDAVRLPKKKKDLKRIRAENGGSSKPLQVRPIIFRPAVDWGATLHILNGNTQSMPNLANWGFTQVDFLL